MENKRKLTKVGSILSIIAWSLNILSLIASGILVLLVFDILISAGGEIATSAYTSLMQLIIAFVISILLIVYSAKAISTSNKDLESYMKKKSSILFVAIVNLLNAFYSIIDLTDTLTDNGTLDTFTIIIMVASIIVCLLLLVSGIMISVDYSRANKEFKSLQTTKVETSEQNNEEPVEEKLEKLNKMRKNGLISEEEYEKLKSDLLK